MAEPGLATRSGSLVITARAAACFEPVPRSVAAARAFVRDTLQGWGFSDIVDDAVVLTSELVTNAVIHAGTSADVLVLRSAGECIRVEVSDRYPEREVPLQHPERGLPAPDQESGRGLMLCSALATRWGVDYAPARKHVWFQLDLPARPVGTRFAGPALPDRQLPVADSRVRVAVLQIGTDGTVTTWNEDAEHLFGYPAGKVTGRPLGELAAWPHTPGTGTGLAEALALSRWEGSYGIRCADGRVIPVYASHLRVRDAEGTASTVCLLVHEQERAVLQTPARTQSTDPGQHPEPRSADPFEVFIGSPAPDDLDGLLQRTVERARDMLDADAAFLLLATDDETELEVRATTGLPSTRQRFARVPVEAGTGRYGSARMPAVHDDLAAVPGAVPLLGGTGMRSVVTVPLKVEGRLTGSLGVATEAPGRYSNEEALRLQFAADRIALAVESARLGELERLRRGSLSFLVEASDLLAGTLDRDQTLALMAQMTVPTLATWCAVYTIADQASDPHLAYVLHEDEDRIDGLKALLTRISPPEPVNTPGARPWTAPTEAAHQAALRTSMRALDHGAHDGPDGRTPGLGAVLATAAAVGGETVVLPLMARNRVIGMLTLGKPTDEHFRQEIVELAEDLSRRAALALDNARLYSERMAISRSLQRSLLPPSAPAIPGVEVEVIYRAAGEGNEVGGDFYDVFPIRDGSYGFAIGDVCGTGPEAAAVTGLARHALRLLAREGFGGPAVLERLNAAILDEGTRSRFLTLLYGELRPREDGGAQLKLVCAGHPLPLRLRPDGRVEPAAEPQPLLGVMDDLELYEENVTLDPGDVLLCVTDGVTERREGTRMLGDDGLTEVLTSCTGLTAGAVAARVLRAVERFAAEPASDDMAILAFRIPGPRQGD
ncbi:SpoIIE family protein phosphatase [Streptomyces bambusae]|uniref:SpoIIE family protein phosphatase n=1 Tax=Streptomyces bambusae TaxID=1550616 RepID=UPI001CFFE15A|nr:SpoIIE family protein phosphatase [Streptomyces bambusae]MCB5169375.1 SpoIIE family protein phosphatase [Streptomyces bambusae]